MALGTSGSAMRTVPLSSHPAMAAAEVSTSGRETMDASVPEERTTSARVQPPEEGEVLEDYFLSGLASIPPYSWWIEGAETWKFAEQLEIYYGIMEEDGYWCRMPVASDRIASPPPGYIGVYTRQLQYGLRFPLHPFVTAVLNGYDIPLCQLTPVSIRRIMTYLWTCLFLGYEPDVHCFHEIHRLVRNTQGDRFHGRGWWQIEDKRGYLSVWPNDTSDKDWRGQWIWVRAPSDEGHPHFFGAPRTVRRPDPKMTNIGPPELTAEDQLQINHFGRLTVTGARGRQTMVPKRWLPCYHYIFKEEMLAVVGLSRRYQDGKMLGWG